MKRSDKKPKGGRKSSSTVCTSDVLETMQRKPERLVCTCENRGPKKPHRAPCPLTGKYAGRVQPSKPMTPRQKKQRKAFDARRVVLPKSIEAELRAIIAWIEEPDPFVGPIVAKTLRDTFPQAFKHQK